MHNLKVFGTAFASHFGQCIYRATVRFTLIIQPLIFSFIFYNMYKNSDYPYYANYVILGSGLASLWSTCCFSSAVIIESERFLGTLENIFCSPANFKVIILGKVMANTVLGILSLILSTLFVKIFFNGNLHIESVGLFLVAFIMVLISFTSITLVVASLFTLSRNIRALMNCIEYPMYILCGMVVPITFLPKFIRGIGYLLPPTWSVDMLRMTCNGINSYYEFGEKLILSIILNIIFLLIGKLMFNKIDKLTRINATLGGL